MGGVGSRSSALCDLEWVNSVNRPVGVSWRAFEAAEFLDADLDLVELLGELNTSLCGGHALAVMHDEIEDTRQMLLLAVRLALAVDRQGSEEDQSGGWFVPDTLCENLERVLHAQTLVQAGQAFYTGILRAQQTSPETQQRMHRSR